VPGLPGDVSFFMPVEALRGTNLPQPSPFPTPKSFKSAFPFERACGKLVRITIKIIESFKNLAEKYKSVPFEVTFSPRPHCGLQNPDQVRRIEVRSIESSTQETSK
jgi:hypothetical protein